MFTLPLCYHSAGAASYMVYAHVSRLCTKIMASVGSAVGALRAESKGDPTATGPMAIMYKVMAL